MAPRSQSLPLPDGMPSVSIKDGNPFEAPAANDSGSDNISFDDGVVTIKHGDGTVTVDFAPKKKASTGEQNGNEHTANLAEKIDDDELQSIASDLLDGIQHDEDSRVDWLNTRARGISLLGLKLKTPRADIGSDGSGVEGMSSIDHPIILEATVQFQATARAELLPASGPVKVRNDSPPDPDMPISQTNAQNALKKSLVHTDKLAQALEDDLNHYLTVTATEYVPDTDRMLFYIGFGGDGFKKVYNCPLRRRPVSESVDAEDLIVSNAATDLKNCGRVTHRIKMRKSTLKRMQIIGAYRDVELTSQTLVNTTEVDKKKEELVGIKSTNQRPEDRDYELYETYCELDLDEFAPKQFKGKGLPLPYRVTIHKESRQILDVRRNWKEDDENCEAKQFFVQFPFIRGLGFYGLGYIHLLGNIAMTLTATWRETIDAGMYSTFPGFIYNKMLGRQLTNQFRVPPGGGIGLDLGPNQRIQDAIMAIPYKEPGGAFTQFITHVEEVGQRLGQTANIQVGEGKQDAPVGTTLALIEQATKVLDSAHKRLHASQAEEFGLLKERFYEDPEAFWRFNKNPSMPWEREQFVEALNNCNIVPTADPNNPTSLHRVAKAATIKELQKASPDLYDPYAVDMRVMNITGIDPNGLFRPTQAERPPDPRMEAIKEKSLNSKMQAQIQLQDSQLRAHTTMAQLAGREEDRKSRERIEFIKLQLEKLKLSQAGVIHDKTAYADSVSREADQRAQIMKMGLEVAREKAKAVAEVHKGRTKHISDVISKHVQHKQKLEADGAAHSRKTQADLLAKQHDAMMSAALKDKELTVQQSEAERARAHEKDLEMLRSETQIKAAAAKPKPAAKPAAKKGK